MDQMTEMISSGGGGWGNIEREEKREIVIWKGNLREMLDTRSERRQMEGLRDKKRKSEQEGWDDPSWHISGDQAYIPSCLSRVVHTFSLRSSTHASIHPSFAPPTDISLRNLTTKKSCQVYFLVIVRPSSHLHPLPPPSLTRPRASRD